MEGLIRKMMAGKKVAIMGFGLEGRSSLRLLRKVMPEQRFHILDKKTELRNDPVLIADDKLVLHLGDDMLLEAGSFDFIIKSPGIPKREFPGIAPERITSQTDLFLRRFHEQVIGVTGTKGKSTTSSLISSILQTSGKHCMLLGNIGIPPFEGVADITPDTLIVMELSSHQLEFLTRAPHISLLLNIFQEHLDHYASYEDYQQAKLNIAKFQSDGDYFIFAGEHALLLQLVKRQNLRANLLPYIARPSLPIDGIYLEDGNVVLKQGEISSVVHHSQVGNHLPGEHNFTNIMAACAAAALAGSDCLSIDKAVSNFQGLQHRIEFVAELEGIRYYNDSIATIPEATMEAVKALKEVDTLILGGYDRKIDYSALYLFLMQQSISNLIFIGDAGRRMYDEMKQAGPLQSDCMEAANFDEVVELARKYTRKGGICLLSPAASSYDMFKNFEHRGNIFKSKVRSFLPTSDE